MTDTLAHGRIANLTHPCDPETGMIRDLASAYHPDPQPRSPMSSAAHGGDVGTTNPHPMWVHLSATQSSKQINDCSAFTPLQDLPILAIGSLKNEDLGWLLRKTGIRRYV